jgi:hypothetical protein
MCMQLSHGEPTRRIWLLGDSAPNNREYIRHPLDERHPTRHNIWTPILSYIQEEAFIRGIGGAPARLRTDAFYVENAVHDPSQKPQSWNSPWDGLTENLEVFRKKYQEFGPVVIITFGAFAFEFARRACEPDSDLPRSEAYWGVPKLGEEFKKRVRRPDSTVVPLLHVSIARRRWSYCHHTFTGDPDDCYFSFTGRLLAKRLLNMHSREDIWLCRGES